MAQVKKSESIPQTMEAIYQQIIALTDEFSQTSLNAEYAQLIRYATAALCRKRPSPLMKGKINVWACGITYAIGFVNFLFDQSQDPSLSATELCGAFGFSNSTGAAKARVVRETLNFSRLDPDWCLPSKLDSNPMAWMIMVNGLIVDARYVPREIQVMAYEKGLIPYIPAESPLDEE